MALNDFLAAVAGVSKDIAGQYGLTPAELQLAMLTTAGLEGGLGENAGVGDGGASVGRYQFNTAGGHGSTLLNQGYSLDQISDDTFQAEHWGPILAQALATAKASGYTGGEAIRQAAFAAERPAQIYSSDRVNGALESASGMMGGAPSDTTGGNGRPSMPDSDSAQITAAMTARVKAALDAYNKSHSPDDYQKLQNALFDLGTWQDANPDTLGGRTDPAQQAFDNAIKLGDYNANQADRLYSRWRDKNTLAQQSAVDQINTVKDRNEARNEPAQTYGASPPETRTYFAPLYEDALKRWQTKYGLGNEPAATFDSGLTMPAAAAATKANAWSLDNSFIKAPQSDVVNPMESPGWTPGDPWKQSYGADNSNKQPGTPWWRTLGEGVQYGVNGVAGIFGFKKGTSHAPGGPAVVNENGPETIIRPGEDPTQMPGGKQLVDVPQGSAVIPAGVPADQAYLYAQIRKGAAQSSPTDNPEATPEAQQARANDPQLLQKVRDSLLRAVAALDTVDPPPTPQLVGNWSDLGDPWEARRATTGEPAVPPEQQAAQQQQQTAPAGVA